MPFLKLVKISLSLALLFLMIHVYSFKSSLEPFFIDEYHFLRKTYYFNLFFVNRDTKDIRFYSEAEASQPKVGIYIYGASLYLKGISNPESFLARYNFDKLSSFGEPWIVDYWGKKFNEFPPEAKDLVEVFWYLRSVSILFAISSLALVYFVCLKLKGFIYAFITTFLVGINGLVTVTNVVATTDSILMFFSFLSVFLTLKVKDKLDKLDIQKAIMFSSILGFVSALGAGTKVSGILILIFVLLFYSVYFLVNISKKSRVKAIAVNLLLYITSFFITFIYFHPLLYKDTLSNFIFTFAGRLESTSIAQYHSPMLGVYSRIQAFSLIVRDTLLPHGRYLSFYYRDLPLDMITFLLGLFLILKRTIGAYTKSHKIIYEGIILLWFVVMFFGLVFYLRIDWSRYYMETKIAMILIEAYLISHLVGLYWNFIKRLYKS